MSKDKSGLGDVEFAGKLQTQTFKQLQLERLLKSGAVIPASKLAEAKELELQRVRGFEQAAQEEQRQRKKVSRQPPKDLDVPLTREYFEE
jgi:hypothetical protein